MSKKTLGNITNPLNQMIGRKKTIATNKRNLVHINSTHHDKRNAFIG